MNQKFIPLTEEQLIAAEKGELKLKCRNGDKITQIMWVRPPYNQTIDNVLIAFHYKSRRFFYKDGRYNSEIGSIYDLFIDHEETAKLNKPKHKCSYGGQLTGVPDKVVHLMVKRQVEQGNIEDIAVFERYVRADYDNGGFHWAKTPEKGEKWYDILINKKYDLVPDEIEVVGNKSQYEKGQAIEVYDEIDCTWIEAKFIAFDGDIVVARHEESYYGFELHRPVSVININGKVISLKEASEFINNLLSK